MLTKKFFWRSETAAARKKFGPAIRSNTILAKLYKLNPNTQPQNGITTPVRASLDTSVGRKKQYQPR